MPVLIKDLQILVDGVKLPKVTKLEFIPDTKYVQVMVTQLNIVPIVDPIPDSITGEIEVNKMIYDVHYYYLCELSNNTIHLSQKIEV